ncbi:MAG: Rieske (2Fe-2S) protein [Solirubrobacteraceae bacterium]
MPRGTAEGRQPAGEDPAVTRRALLTRALGAIGTVALALSAISTLARGRYRVGTTSLGARRAGSGTSKATVGASDSTASTATKAPQRSSAAGKLPAGAVRIGASGQLPPGQGGLYTDPIDHQPDILVRHGDGTLSAFSAICTHQGCQVGYQGDQISCPCHGGLFNARTGAVEGGPPPAPLPTKRVLERGGTIYAIPS